MNNNKAEQERKELNKKLLKGTYKSELKNRKKMTIFNFLINFVVIFIGLSASNLIIEILPIDFWLLDMGVSVLIVMGALYIASILVQRMNERE